MLKKRDLVGHNLPLLLAGLVILALIVLINSFQLPKTDSTVTVGCVLLGSKDDHGWNEGHFTGISEASKTHNTVLKVCENIDEDREELLTAVETLVREGCTVVYLTSFGYGQFTEEISQKYPHVAFFSIWGNSTAKNCATYLPRLYQVQYLAGVIAGSQTKTDKLGFVAAMPNAHTSRSINSYALGVRFANPKARIIVKYTNIWSDEQKERESVDQLAKLGVDIVSFHQDTPYTINEAEKIGLYSIGYNTIAENYSDHFLTAALYNWKIIYKKTLGDYLKGKANLSENYWLSIQDNAVKLASLSPLVTERARHLMEQEKERIINQRSVFSGIIYDNSGKLRCDKDERISDHELYYDMNWLVEGVEIYE